jgi:CubicO group peptidase (beta-lactamase class C family)
MDIVEKLTQSKFANFLDSVFYSPLGLNTLTYNPLQKYDLDEITPTENDLLFRKRLIHGYVHDPGAAMMGGIAGHAGLFSSANDLAKLFQMMLNNGEYGGEKFLSKEVIKEFVKCQFCDEDNRRGAGFDRRTSSGGPACSCVSYDSFGHTGFTGTMVWADPQNQLIYIFLSNRVYPDAESNKLLKMGIRTDIQEVVYNSIQTKL